MIYARSKKKYVVVFRPHLYRRQHCVSSPDIFSSLNYCFPKQNSLASLV